MTANSQSEATGIALQVADPLLRANRRQHIDTITRAVGSYGHTLSAFMGFDSAKASINADANTAEDWLDDGLGRDILAVDSDLGEAFNGFANVVELVFGHVTIRRGPLLDIANRTYSVYRPVDTTVNPPTVGNRTPTVITEDLESQARYGIIEQVLSAGQVPQADAEQLRDAYLLEHHEPETSQTISSSPGQPRVNLDILGYGHWLKAYVYNQVAVSGTTTVYLKLLAVLAADPNGIVSTDYSEVYQNAVLTAAYENDDPYGLTLIKEMTALGGPTDQRMLFQVLEGRKVYFQPQPSIYEYVSLIGDGRIRDLGGNVVAPWKIRPGKGIKVVDLLPAAVEPAVLRDDPRSVFIESVTYDAPGTFSIEGSKTDTIPQKLAKLGMAGIFA